MRMARTCSLFPWAEMPVKVDWWIGGRGRWSKYPRTRTGNAASCGSLFFFFLFSFFLWREDVSNHAVYQIRSLPWEVCLRCMHVCGVVSSFWYGSLIYLNACQRVLHIPIVVNRKSIILFLLFPISSHSYTTRIYKCILTSSRKRENRLCITHSSSFLLFVAICMYGMALVMCMPLEM